MIKLIDNQDKTPAILSAGFRLMFLLATIFAIIGMLLWFLLFDGEINNNYNNNTWHAHEMVFAYSLAVIAGFLLTAVGNWTKIKTIKPYPLLALGVLWFFGRFLLIIPQELLIIQAIIDIAFSIVLIIIIAKPIVQAKNWVNLSIVGKLGVIGVAHIIFYLEIGGIISNNNLGIYLAFFTIISLILMMINRLLPFFINNTLKTALVDYPQLNKVNLALFVVFLLSFLMEWGLSIVISSVMLFVLHSFKLIKWHNLQIWYKPLLSSMYLAYALITLGFLLLVIDYFVPLMPNIAQHSFAFGITFVSFAMMARVSLGHTGRNVFKPPKSLNLILIILFAAFLLRVFAVVFIGDFYYYYLIIFSQVLWILAFILFFITYLPIWWGKHITNLT
jgi:uncharacterized protein involved in response to NO